MKYLISTFLALLLAGALNEAAPQGFPWPEYSLVIADSDVILLGSLEKLPSKEFHEEFYSVSITQILKGVPDASEILAVPVHVDSTEGSSPAIEPGHKYLLFLRRTGVVRPFESSNPKAYRLVGNWKGIVPVDETSKEKRAVQNVLKHYDVNLLKEGAAFREVISYVVSSGKTDLSPDAKKLSEALKMDMPAASGGRPD